MNFLPSKFDRKFNSYKCFRQPLRILTLNFRDITEKKKSTLQLKLFFYILIGGNNRVLYAVKIKKGLHSVKMNKYKFRLTNVLIIAQCSN